MLFQTWHSVELTAWLQLPHPNIPKTNPAAMLLQPQRQFRFVELIFRHCWCSRQAMDGTSPGGAPCL
jgi:hypothetical protein